MFSARWLQNLILSFLALALSLSLWLAIVSGIRAGKSTVILKNTEALQYGLNYFFKDQNRYPTALEFADPNIMANYLTSFPAQDIAGGPCQKTYGYRSDTAKTYELNFCLPKASAGFAAGWNKIQQP